MLRIAVQLVTIGAASLCRRSFHSTPESPKWWMVDVQLVRRTVRPVTLAELRAEGERGEPIRSMTLINKWVGSKGEPSME